MSEIHLTTAASAQPQSKATVVATVQAVEIEALDDLRARLSASASINTPANPEFAINSARWSELHAPKPGAVVNVACEKDIEATVQWATKHGVPFMAQSGGHAWSSWFKIGAEGVVVNMRKLNSVEINTEKGVAVVGGGAIVKEVTSKAKASKVHVALGGCDTVGVVSSITGGGIGHFMGLYGCGVDNMVSARIVTADGVSKTVSATENAELWWALRGAAHNFGIISSLTVKTHPEINGGLHYIAMLAFPDAKLEQVAETVSGLKMEETMDASILFIRPPPTFDAVVAVPVWHAGSEETATKKFAPLFEMEPFIVQEGMVPYDHLNDGLEPMCAKGGNKPIWSVSVNDINPKTLRGLWDDFVTFSSNEDAKGSIVNIEAYPTDRARSVPLDATAVCPAIRSMRFHCFLCAVYTDPGLHPAARRLGEKFREVMNGSSEKHMVYANFATGDETMAQLYGGSAERLEKLKALKGKYDSQGIFSHYIPIVP